MVSGTGAVRGKAPTAGVGLVLVSLLLPWFSVSVEVNEVSPTVTTTLPGWATPTAIVVVVLAVVGYGYYRWAGENPVSPVLALVAAALGALSVFSPPFSGAAIASGSAGVGVYVAVVGAVALAVGSYGGTAGGSLLR